VRLPIEGTKNPARPSLEFELGGFVTTPKNSFMSWKTPRFNGDIMSPLGMDSPSTSQTLLKLNLVGDLISYQLNVQDIENVTMAHIHIADLWGGEGPPAVWLYNYGQTGFVFYSHMCYDINVRGDFEKEN
jgi:hypothetical protein